MNQELWEEAAQAVREVTGERTANVVKCLKKGKSQVFLVARNGGRPPVVAKRADKATVDVERRILELLRSAPMRALYLYGVADSGDTGRDWLITEFAAGERFDRESTGHRHLAGQWMARLHRWSQSEGPLPLPDRAADYHRTVADEAISTLDAAEVALAQTAVDLEPLRGLQTVATRLVERWEEIGQALGGLPSVLVHSGFGGKNVVIGQDEGGAVVLAFDWELGGWGSAATDLSAVDLEAYVEAQGRNGSTPAAVHRVALIGRVLWALAAIPGERSNFLGPWPHRALSKLPVYLRESGEAMDELERQS